MSPGSPCGRFPICGTSLRRFFLHRTNPGQEDVMNEECRKAPQGELFAPEPPTTLLTDERVEVLIPVLSMILAVAMTIPTAAPDNPTSLRAGHDG